MLVFKPNCSSGLGVIGLNMKANAHFFGFPIDSYVIVFKEFQI